MLASLLLFAAQAVPGVPADAAWEVSRAGSAKQIAKSARNAIACGFERVLVRPFQPGDISEPPSGYGKYPRPTRVLLLPPTVTQADAAAASCFDKKEGGPFIIA